MENSFPLLTAEYLWKVGNLLSETCPAVSRSVIFNLRRLPEKPQSIENLVSKRFVCCEYCGNIWSPGNHRVRICSCPSLPKTIKKLLKKEEWTLTLKERKKIKNFKRSSSKIVYSCFVCKKKTVFPGARTPVLPAKEVYEVPFFSTPLSKKKRRNRDLNAGLFISTPASADKAKMHKNITKNITEESSKKQFLTPVATSSRTKTPQPSNTIKTSGKKRNRKSLMSKILREEQEKKKRPGLSAFLVPL